MAYQSVSCCGFPSGLDDFKWSETDPASKVSELSEESLKVSASSLKVLVKVGGGLSVLGKTFQLFKQGSSLSSAFKTATTGITATSTAAEGAVASTGLLAKGSHCLGTLSPGESLIGGVAVGVIATVAKRNGGDANERTQTWGTSVKQATRPKLSRLKSKVDEVHQATVGFGQGVHKRLKMYVRVCKGLPVISKAIDKDLRKLLKGLKRLVRMKQSKTCCSANRTAKEKHPVDDR